MTCSVRARPTAPLPLALPAPRLHRTHRRPLVKHAPPTPPPRGAGDTPLHHAARSDNPELVRLLLSAGADSPPPPPSPLPHPPTLAWILGAQRAHPHPHPRLPTILPHTHPTPTLSPTLTPTLSPTLTPTPTPTLSPTLTPAPTPTLTPTLPPL